MASESNSNNAVTNIAAQMEMVVLPNVHYEILKILAYLLFSSKFTSLSDSKEIVVYTPRSARFVEYCAGVEGIYEREKIVATELFKRFKPPVKNVKVNVAGAINEEQAARVVEDILNDLENSEKAEADLVKSDKGKSVVVENPGGVVGSDDTELLFGCSMEEVRAPKEDGEALAGADQTLEALEQLGNIAKFKESSQGRSLKGYESGGDNDCHIIETSSTASRKKMPRTTTMRKQPARVGKRKLEVQEEEMEAPKSSVKRVKKTKVAVNGKEILMEMECSEKFFKEEKLSDVFDMIKAQGWEKLCESQDFVCPEAVHDFYKELILVDGEIPALEVKFRGRKFRVYSMELALILGLPHSGYDWFSKGNSWPEDGDSKKELVKRICGLDVVPKGSISTKFMDSKVRILHKLLVSNFIQRGAKSSYCQHEDLLLLDKILKNEKVNLPKLMIYQMNRLKNLTQLGFSRVIKKILQMHKVYEVNSGVEQPVVKDFDPDVFRKMNLMKDSELGWIRTSIVQEAEIVQEPESMEDDDDLEVDHSEFLAISSVIQRLNAVEKGVSDVKNALKGLKEELREVKDGVLALLSKF